MLQSIYIHLSDNQVSEVVFIKQYAIDTSTVRTIRAMTEMVHNFSVFTHPIADIDFNSFNINQQCMKNSMLNNIWSFCSLLSMDVESWWIIFIGIQCDDNFKAILIILLDAVYLFLLSTRSQSLDSLTTTVNSLYFPKILLNVYIFAAHQCIPKIARKNKWK